VSFEVEYVIVASASGQPVLAMPKYSDCELNQSKLKPKAMATQAQRSRGRPQDDGITAS
jgi:hypothetical protein